MELLALGLAALRIASALALGGILLGLLERKGLDGPVGGSLGALLAVLAGIAVQGGAHYLLAKLGWGGVVAPAVALDIAFLAVLWAARGKVRQSLEAVRDEYRAYVTETGRWGVAVLAVGAAVLFVLAAGPPRDTDVLRYHLALPQQIVTEGHFPLWRNYHYHFPQAYTFATLSELAAGVPQAVQYVSALLYIMLGAGLIALCRGRVGREAMIMLVALFAFHPGLLKMATTAHSDIIIIVTTTLATGFLLLAREHPPAHPWVGAAGLTTGLGMAFRYQQAGWVIALPIAVLLLFRSASVLTRCVIGIAIAVLVVWPVYAVNAIEMGNPIWPLAISLFNDPNEYANHVAGAFTTMLHGGEGAPIEGRAASGLVIVARRFLVDAFLAGGALMMFVTIPLSVGLRRLRPVGVLFLVFLIIWWVFQPWLFPRFLLMLFPIGIIVVARAWRALPGILGGVFRGAFVLYLVFLIGMTAWYTLDYASYFVTRDLDEFHRHTWFYESHQRLNRMLDDSNRVLVIEQSGDSFYLRIPYLKADPAFAGEIDWRVVDEPEELASEARERGITHIFFDETRLWDETVEGRDMQAAVQALMADPTLARVLGRWRQPLSESRVRNVFRVDTVYLIELLPPSSSPARVEEGADEG